MATYKTVMRPALEYASSVWSPIASSTSIENCHRMHTNIQHLHDETLTLPIHAIIKGERLRGDVETNPGPTTLNKKSLDL